jgi:hypothetical protein
MPSTTTFALKLSNTVGVPTVFDNFSENVVVEGIIYSLGLGIQLGERITIS